MDMNNTNTPARIGTIEYCRYGYSTGETIEIHIRFATECEALAAIAKFPKSTGVRLSRLFAADGVIYSAKFRVELASGLTTGEANETGAKRLAKFRKVVSEHYAHLPRGEFNRCQNRLPIEPLL